jgi:hypothetical protein
MEQPIQRDEQVLTNQVDNEGEFDDGFGEQQLNVSQELDRPEFDQMATNQEDNQKNEAEDDEEGESVYMIDGVVMQKIQIEGEPDQFLMDAQGRIYDMQANFVGTYPNNQEQFADFEQDE